MGTSILTSKARSSHQKTMMFTNGVFTLLVFSFIPFQTTKCSRIHNNDIIVTDDEHNILGGLREEVVDMIDSGMSNLMSEKHNIPHMTHHEIVRRSYLGSEPSRPLIVYLTPENAERIINSIEIPSWKELRNRKKPFTIFVEGIVGTGKSTFLKAFEKYPMMDILPEPVSKWMNLNGTDMLQLIYDDPERWSTAQESYVQLTMLEEHLRTGSILKAMERSMHSARHCFSEYFYQSGTMKHVEYALLDSWYQFLTNSESTGFDTDADMIFYLQTEPEIAFERVQRRGRVEEKSIQMDFLNGLHKLHEDWLIHGNTTAQARVPSPKVYVLNTRYSLPEMNKIYKAIANRFWLLLPKELKNRQCWLY